MDLEIRKRSRVEDGTGILELEEGVREIVTLQGVAYTMGRRAELTVEPTLEICMDC